MKKALSATVAASLLAALSSSVAWAGSGFAGGGCAFGIAHEKPTMTMAASTHKPEEAMSTFDPSKLANGPDFVTRYAEANAGPR